MTDSYDQYRKKSVDGCRDCPPRKACEGAEISFVGSGCVEGGGEISLRQPNDAEIEFHVDCPGNGKLSITTCEALEGGGDFYANAKCNEDINLCLNTEWLHSFVMSRVCNGELSIITSDDMKGGGKFTANQCNNTNIVLSVNWEKFPACNKGGLVMQDGCWRVNVRDLIADLPPVSWDDITDKPDCFEPCLPDQPNEACNGAGTCCIFGTGLVGDRLEAEHKDCAGTVTYQWQQRVSGSWEDIKGATSRTYKPTSPGTYRCQMTCTTTRSAEALEASTGCIGCKDPTREDLLAEINKIAIKPMADAIGGSADSHCIPFEDKDCSPFRWDCMIDNAVLCHGSKGVVELDVSTHGCNGRCHENGGGRDLSYEWEWSKSKDSGYKTLRPSSGGGSTIKFQIKDIPWEPEAGETVWVRAIANCSDHPNNKRIVGGGGRNGNNPIRIDIVDCCGGDKVCADGKHCCNKEDHPDQPSGCQTCCKNSHCPGDQICEDGKCKDKPAPDPASSEKVCNSGGIIVDDPNGDGGGGGGGDTGPEDDGSKYPFLYTRMWGEINAKPDKTRGEAEIGFCSKTTDNKNCVSVHKAEFVNQSGKQASWFVTLKFAHKLPTANYIVNATVKKGSYDHFISVVNEKDNGVLDPKEGFTVILHDVENNTSMPGSDSRQNSNHVCDFTFSVIW